MTDQEREAPILEGKLYPATGTRRPLSRPRLDSCTAVLDGAHRVTLLSAPAGYGKSTLMAQWHGHLVERGIACAWLSLDEDDGDKVRFMRHLIAALQKANVRLGRTRNLDLPGGAKPVLEALAADLATARQRLVLFLDDLHFVQDPDVLEIVDWLANYAPPSMQQIIGSRETRHLRLSALRVRGQLFELNLRQLRFDAEEASQFFRKRLGRDLPARSIAIHANPFFGSTQPHTAFLQTPFDLLLMGYHEFSCPFNSKQLYPHDGWAVEGAECLRLWYQGTSPEAPRRLK